MIDLDYEILVGLMRTYILERPCFNKSKLADSISFRRQHFNEWIKEERPLPKDRVDLLKKLLNNYGFLN